MTTTTVRMPEEDYKKVKMMAAFEGITVSEFMRKTILEQVEDSLDYQEGLAVLAEKNDRISREDVIRGLSD
ncbi:type II toxin-antitoxin system RelB family antitoxin [Enterococcus sp. LJL120]